MNRGYNEVRAKLEKSKNYLASCQNCKFFINGECENPNVTPYDVTIDGDRTFCSYWEIYKEPDQPDKKKVSKKKKLNVHAYGLTEEENEAMTDVMHSHDFDGWREK